MENKKSVKQDVLRLLEENRNEYLSGESIAAGLGVSRNAVWKAISALRSEGYDVEAVQNKGYKLEEATDRLSKQGIEKYLFEKLDDFYDIEFFEEVGSTNKILKERASAGAGEGAAVVAAAQTEGRGRLGRSFFSPGGSGIYLSVLLKPKTLSAAESAKITTVAAVAVCDAVERVQRRFLEKDDLENRAPSIKWVNDVFAAGKKVCGILTEASIGLENGALEYIVLGVGINIYPPAGGFPEELKDIAGSVFLNKFPDAKNLVAAEFLISFFGYYSALTAEKTRRGGYHAGFDYIEKYKKRSFVVGKRVRVILNSASESAREALVLGMDDELRLLVQYDDGTVQTLSSGEISIKLN